MSGKGRVLIAIILVLQYLWQMESKTLPTKIGNDDGERKNLTTSYYRHNIFGPNTYAFGFEVNDKGSGNMQFRDESRCANGTIQGSYGYLRPDGIVMVTRFLADSDRGYLSQSKTFAPGDELKWEENWPIKKTMRKIPLEPSQSEVIYDDEGTPNLTSILLPVKAITEEHGINLNPPELEKQLVNPAVLEVLNGETPLISDSIGFETINKFIPSEFPIVPFELPDEDIMRNVNEGLGAKPIPVKPKKTNNSDEQNAKDPLDLSDDESLSNGTPVRPPRNNTLVPLTTEALKMAENSKKNLNTSSRRKSVNVDTNSDWYDKVMTQTRHKYVETGQ